jgi:hypothetical protein
MKRQRRFDQGTLDKAERLPNGFLKADAFLTRTGVFPYMNADGTIRRELRLPEEVFKEDSMKTLELATLTLGHPRVPVTALNAKELGVGTVGQDVREDSDKLRSTVMVQDNAAIEAMEDDGIRQTSCGYYCDLEPKPGITEDGEEYDFIQRNIDYNHVALVPHGRAGPEVAVRLDSADDAVMVTDEMAALQAKAKNTSAADQPKLDGLFGGKEGTPLSNSVAMLMRGRNLDEEKIAEHLDVTVAEVSSLLHGDAPLTNDQVNAVAQFLDIPVQVLHALVPEGSGTEQRNDSPERDKGFQETMMKFKLTIDGIEHEYEASETSHKTLAKHLDALSGLVEEAGKALDTEKARADSAEEKVVTLTKERNDAIDPSVIDAKVAARVALQTQGATVLGDDFKADATDDDIKRAIVLKVSPSAAGKIADCSADYLQARFDQAIESHSELHADAQGNGDVARIVETGKPSLAMRLDEARKKQKERQDAMWKTPLATSKDARA